MTLSNPFVVRVVPAAELHELRRTVLRNGDPTKVVSDPRDDDEDARHFGGFLDEQLVAAGSFYPSTSPLDPAQRCYQLRYLATSTKCQGRGAGTILLRAAESYLTGLGVDQLWANGRDTALGFYRRVGWETVPGSEHLSAETQLPHTVIVRALRTKEPVTFGWAAPRDAADLAQLREEMYFAIVLCEYSPEWVAASEEFFARDLENDRTIAAVARNQSGEVIASAAATLRRVPPTPRFPRGDDAYLHTVSTRPAYRRRGLSRALVTKVIEELRTRNVERVELHATAPGENLYRDLGFVVRGGSPEMRLGLTT